ncbi:hypothetical protein H2201_006205 [Coniosporium apollinis]|uniref:Kinetochore protein Spc24 n=2 Tax=Coniosporium TaxID=2810619 RepID=A0ABQ9NRJ8_9PEZI|nr:hypothetical protein H2199_007902 [Cladosporium sp. JES 115]KAJ9662097.1 hypothetical protein H2201_006205 [Coniosporium apollinis]
MADERAQIPNVRNEITRVVLRHAHELQSLRRVEEVLANDHNLEAEMERLKLSIAERARRVDTLAEESGQSEARRFLPRDEKTRRGIEDIMGAQDPPGMGWPMAALCTTLLSSRQEFREMQAERDKLHEELLRARLERSNALDKAGTTFSSLVESVDTVISSVKYRPELDGPEDWLVRCQSGTKNIVIIRTMKAEHILVASQEKTEVQSGGLQIEHREGNVVIVFGADTTPVRWNEKLVRAFDRYVWKYYEADVYRAQARIIDEL